MIAVTNDMPSNTQREVAEYHTLPEQLVKLSEECHELGAEACKAIQARELSRAGLVEEIADVLNVIEQIIYLTDTSAGIINSQRVYKQTRELSRIREGYYESDNSKAETGR